MQANVMHEQTPPSEQDAKKTNAQAAEPTPTMSGTESEEWTSTQAEIRRLSAALEDIVALAHSSGDHRERVILMQRRAIAALSGTDRKPPAGSAKR